MWWNVSNGENNGDSNKDFPKWRSHRSSLSLTFSVSSYSLSVSLLMCYILCNLHKTQLFIIIRKHMANCRHSAENIVHSWTNKRMNKSPEHRHCDAETKIERWRVNEEKRDGGTGPDQRRIKINALLKLNRHIFSSRWKRYLLQDFSFSFKASSVHTHTHGVAEAIKV